MNAVVQNRYGSPEALQLAVMPAPRVGATEVLVAVQASAVTAGDRRLRAGDFPALSWLPGRLMIGLTGPRNPTPGTIFAGRVIAIGQDVRRFSVGDDVFGVAMRGAYAEQLVVSEQSPIARMPAGFGYAEAAALPYGGMTALVFLREFGALQPGQRVCVLGASGGVGLLAVQLAKQMGAAVTGVCSRSKQALVRELGAEVVLDYRTEDFLQTSQPFDVILDTLGTSSFAEARAALSAKGRYLSLVADLSLLLQMPLTALWGGQRALTGVAMGGPKEMEDVAKLAETGALRPVIDGCYPLGHIAAAHARAESGEAAGAVVVAVAAGALPLRAGAVLSA